MRGKYCKPQAPDEGCRQGCRVLCRQYCSFQAHSYHGRSTGFSSGLATVVNMRYCSSVIIGYIGCAYPSSAFVKYHLTNDPVAALNRPTGPGSRELSPVNERAITEPTKYLGAVIRASATYIHIPHPAELDVIFSPVNVLHAASASGLRLLINLITLPAGTSRITIKEKEGTEFQVKKCWKHPKTLNLPDCNLTN